MRISYAMQGGAMVSLLAATLAQAANTGGTTCSVAGSARVAPIVELYTSEGCNSCPPADRWLSGLKSDAGIVALAFHVDYWDRLGWKDRFASPLYTQRQSQTQATSGARFSYTPQVLVDGLDRKDWPRVRLPLSSAERAVARVEATLARDNQTYIATIAPGTSAPSRLAAYWAVTESGHSTAVKAGENEGVTLRHDHVVREYQPVAAWNANARTTLRFEPTLPRDAAHPATVNLVVVDASTGLPVQALKLGC